MRRATMKKIEKRVPLREAMEQVRITGKRIALMHLAFSRILVEELGEEKGKKSIIRAMMDYGRMVGEANKAGQQDLPFYGFHDKYTYGEKEFRDTREKENIAGNDFDFSRYRVYGCVLADTFLEHDEKELGCLYCYVDSAKSMAVDPGKKLIHTACEVVGDGFCAFDLVPTTERERNRFQDKNVDWKEVDPILIKGSKMDKDQKDKK
jgi:hypothetical protein